MSRFRVGKYDRDKLGVLKPLAPAQSVSNLIDITPEQLLLAGKKLLLVDVDNTLVAWKSERIPESTMTWLGFMKSAGIKICILSNTKRPARLQRLSEEMGIPYLRGRFKPSRRMYLQALAQFEVTPKEAVMVGDQIFTDIFGANRSGIDAIWVKQMAPRDFIGTKLSRLGERLFRKRLYRVISEEVVSEEEGEPPVTGVGAFLGLLRHPTVRQFLKFCVVGGLSTVIDLGLFWIFRFAGREKYSLQLGSWLLTTFPWLFARFYSGQPAEAAVPVLRTISGSVAILNSFLWNRRWTFRIHGKEHRTSQLQKFVVVSLIGLALNVILTTVVVDIIPARTHGEKKVATAIALAVSTVIVAFWNFLGQKHWTFKQKQ